MTKILVILALLCGLAEAHPLDTAYLRVESHGTIQTITFDLDVALAAQELAIEPAALDGVLTARAEELANKLYRSATPTSSEPCRWGDVVATRKGVTVTLVDDVTCKPGNVKWDLSFGTRIAATWKILGKVTDDTGDHVITIDKSMTELTIVTGDHVSFGSAIKQGLESTGILPAGWKRGHPGAIDLILFTIVLLIGARGFGRQARDVGTLIGAIFVGGLLGGFLPWDWLRFPMMAIVVATAITVALGKLERQRWMLAAGVGLLYGVLWHEPQQPIGFSIGLALGAAAVLVVLGPLLGFVQQDKAGPWPTRGIAAIAALVGCYFTLLT